MNEDYRLRYNNSGNNDSAIQKRRNVSEYSVMKSRVIHGQMSSIWNINVNYNYDKLTATTIIFDCISIDCRHKT